METLRKQSPCSWLAYSTLSLLLSFVAIWQLQSLCASTKPSNKAKDNSPIHDLVGQVTRLHRAGTPHYRLAHSDRLSVSNMMERSCQT
jgi:hypothetical protein